jgi:hypothetical protein
MAYRENPDNPVGAINGVHDAEAPHAVFPQPLQFPQDGFSQGGITAESLHSPLDGAL